MTGKVTLKMVHEKEVCAEWYYGSDDGKKMCFVDYDKIAQVFFPYLKRSIDVFYKEYHSYTGCGFEDKVKIEVLEPIRFELIEQGLNAQERCEKKMCQAIARLVHHERVYPWSGCTSS